MSAPEPRSPLAMLTPGPRGRTGDAGVKLQELHTGLAEISSRRGQESALDAALRRDLDLGLPVRGRACEAADAAALWMAPATTLILALPTRLEPLFRNIEPSTAAVLDQSGGFVVLCVEGAMAAAALVKGCRLDLSAQTFSTGSVARTLIAQIPVILYRTGDTRFDVIVPSTLARAFADFACNAAAEFGCLIVRPVRRNADFTSGTASGHCGRWPDLPSSDFSG